MAPRRPAKKAAAKKPAAQKPAAKKAAPRKPPSTAATRKKAAQEAALEWATAYRAPLTFVEGWDPNTGEWSEKSKVGKLLADIGNGDRINTAAKRHNLRHAKELLAKGREYAIDASLSEDRELVPMDVRPFLDFAAKYDEAEGEAEHQLVAFCNEKALEDPRIAMLFLARRFPEHWREQQEILTHLERDPRDAAVAKMLTDPATAVQMAEFARKASKLTSEMEE